MSDIMKEYTISVIMYPHTWDCKLRPYFWMITKDGGMQGHGWSETPEQAWKDANKYYTNCLKDIVINEGNSK